jgi:ATP-dependent Clp protease protease subunit
MLVFGEVTTALAESVSAQLRALAARSSDPMRIVIHSPGGHVEAGDTLHDLIQFIDPPVARREAVQRGISNGPPFSMAR